LKGREKMEHMRSRTDLEETDCLGEEWIQVAGIGFMEAWYEHADETQGFKKSGNFLTS
jgi:hypothetical protein